MKLLRLLAIVMTIGVAVGFTGCDDDDDGVVYNDDYILLGMNQAVKVLAGGECYSNLTLNDEEGMIPHSLWTCRCIRIG